VPGKTHLLGGSRSPIVWLRDRVVRGGGVAISRIRIPAAALHTCSSVTKQYNLVPANRRWCSAAVMVTVGLAEMNGSPPLGLWLRSPAGWLPRTGIPESYTLVSSMELTYLYDDILAYTQFYLLIYS